MSDFAEHGLPMIVLAAMLALSIWGVRKLFALPQAPNVSPELMKRLVRNGFRLWPEQTTESRTSWTTGWLRHGGPIDLQRSGELWSMDGTVKSHALESRPGLWLTLGPGGEERSEMDDEARAWLERIARGCGPLIAVTRTSFTIRVTTEAPRVTLTLAWTSADPSCFEAGRTLFERAAVEIARVDDIIRSGASRSAGAGRA